MSPVSELAQEAELAVVGPFGALGEAVLEALSARPLGGLRLHLLAPDVTGTPRLVEVGERQVAVQALEGFDLSRLALAIFCTEPTLTRRYAPRLEAGGAAVIDCSGALDAELRVAELLNGPGEPPRAVACPDGLTTILALVLAPLARAVGIQRVQAASLESAGSLGRRGVEALDREVRSLLNFREIDSPLFGRQLAFNLLAQPAAAGSAVGALIGEPELQLQLQRVRVPVFHGDALALFVQTREPLEAEAARELLRASGSLRLSAPDEAPPDTLAAAAAGAEGGIHVAVLEGAVGGAALSLWVAADTLRRGVAANAVRLAEVLLKGYL